jgi:hypothetical protein
MKQGDKNDYIVAYVWPFDPLTLTPGLDTKKFSEILTNLANNTRHNIPLEIARRATDARHQINDELHAQEDKTRSKGHWTVERKEKQK